MDAAGWLLGSPYPEGMPMVFKGVMIRTTIVAFGKEGLVLLHGERAAVSYSHSGSNEPRKLSRDGGLHSVASAASPSPF